MKIAYLIHRYGTEIHGGAEHACRMLAERLVSAKGHEVEVHTTCALDPVTWGEEYEPGVSVVNGVTVHRYPSIAGRDPGFGSFSTGVLSNPGRASSNDQERWIELQGPVCPEAIDGVVACDADVVVATPYLYYPTVWGVPRLTGRVVLQPAAHDEPEIRLPIFEKVFGAANGMAYYTDTERRLVERLFPIADRPQAVVGLGVAPINVPPERFRQVVGLGDRPFVVCLGRVDETKGTGFCSEMFAAYKQRNPGPLALVFVGPVIHQPLDHPDILVTGPISEELKWSALRGAGALISPSPFESFSLVLLEAWSVGCPVIVNGRCLTTVEHARRSGAGLWFDGFGTFEAVLRRVLGDSALQSLLVAAGLQYVEQHYTWPAVMERYDRFLQASADRPRLTKQPMPSPKP